MTPRERMLACFAFSRPDRIPVHYAIVQDGLYRHGMQLVDLFRQFPPDNRISIPDRIPEPDPAHLVNGEYFELRRDAWGTLWEFTVFGKPWGQGIREYPLPDLDRLDDYSFPVPGFMADATARELDRLRVAEQKKTHIVQRGGISIFEKICSLHTLEETLIELQTGDPRLLRLLDRLCAYWTEQIDHLLSLGVDVIDFADDWGFQNGPAISPALFRKVYRPRYEMMFSRVRAAGSRVHFHSCGRMGPLLDEFITMGINSIDPQVNVYDGEELADKCARHRVTISIRPDRQRLIPFGTPAEIRAQVRRYAERYRALGGGGYFNIEIENDAPFGNACALLTAIDEFR